MQSFEDEIRNNFSFLTKFGFTISVSKSTLMDEPIAVFFYPSLQIRLLQYHQELYLEFSKIDSKVTLEGNINENYWITFHWLIEYLSDNAKHKTNFFENEINYDNRIKKQICSLSDELKVYITRIINFFDSKNYKEQFEELKKYINDKLKNYGLL